MKLKLSRSLRSLTHACAAAPFFCLGLAAATAAAVAAGPAWLAAFPALCLLFVLYFFRDPWRETPEDAGVLYSSADGVVVKTGPVRHETLPGGKGQRVLIFMSPLDVHRNRAPLAETVREVRAIAGRFVPAYREGMETVNERVTVVFGRGKKTVVVTQIAGILARRIVCRAKAGDRFGQGEEFGLIRFGSSNEILFPDEWETAVAPGERVRAGLTVIARRKR